MGTRALLAAELLTVVIWALVLTRPYLDLDPLVMPSGREYGQAILTHDLWTRARECGWCALWFGGARGGSPAFPDALFGSMLHPLVMVTTLGWGVLNGSKLALAGTFAMAGLAQWWLGYVLGLGWGARVWSACMAVAGGHLGARMELGAFGVVLSTAACALVLPPLLMLSRTGSRHVAVLLGVTLALAALGGQGYMQVGLALTLPAAIALLPWDRARLALLARRFALAGVLALLLAAPFLVPFLHFLPEFAKDADPTFGAAQPFAYVPLNLVVSEHKFYTSNVLGKLPWPAHYANFVGWIPVLLALWGLGAARNREERRAVVFLAALALLAFWVASAAPLAWLAHTLPFPRLAELLAGVRYPAFIAGLAVPPILALAGIGLDRLLRAGWPQRRLALALGRAAPRHCSLDLRWLLVIPLLLALADARAFSSQWIITDPLGPEVPQLLAALRTSDLQWVNTPFGEHWFTEPAVGAGLKLADDLRTWRWKDRPLPQPVLEVHRAAAIPGMTLQRALDGMYVYATPPGREYATVTHADGRRTMCTAQGRGGNIDVACDIPQPGTLTVNENSWSGWQAYVDSQPAPLGSDRWLAVDLPAGGHTVQLRYRPWDVPVGLLLCLAGVVLAIWSWRRGDAPTRPAPKQDATA